MHRAANSSAYPAWASAETIAQARASFERLYGRGLSDEEVAEILANMGNLFRVLAGGGAGSQPEGQP